VGTARFFRLSIAPHEEPKAKMTKLSDPHWYSDIEAPLQVCESDTLDWSMVADVVVIGAGCSGICASIEAADRGARVICIDRFGGGGATTLSGGVVYAAATKIQKNAQIEDSIEDAFRYLKIETGDVVSDETLRSFCRQSAPNLEWLMRIGVVFGERVFEGKASYPPDGYFLYFSGNETSKPYCDQARPAQRGHRTLGKGRSGSAFYAALKSALRSHRNIHFVTHCPVRRLVIGLEGEILGVEVLAVSRVCLSFHRWLEALFTKTPIWNLSRGLPTVLRRTMAWLESQGSRRKLFKAANGVILATGGFAHNRSMVAHYAPHLKAYTPLASAGTDGSGIRLGQTVGGQTSRLDNFDMGRHIAVSEPYVRGVIVNQSGKRFIGEDQYHATIGEKIALEQDGVAWIILDAALYQEAFRRALSFRGKKLAVWLNGVLALLGGLKKSETLAGLAKACKLPAPNLEATIAEYDQIARGQKEDTWGKRLKLLSSLGQGPYYAVNISSNNRFSPVGAFSLGGLMVDEATGAVLGPGDKPIPGLYAVGRDAIGIPSNRYVSGTSLADCVFSGRRAGAAVASGQRSSQGV
jgi:3-oxo-5alpha-steroid 4-dehydrogenase